MLLAGVELLDELLAPHGFRFEFRGADRGSGGEFAWGEYVRGERRLELHFRYSLGLVAYRVGGLWIAHEPYLRALGVPGEVAAFVGELLAKDAQERPESAAEVARSLQELSREHGISATELQGPPSGDVAETQPIDSTAVVPAPHHVDYATVAVPGTGYVPSHRVPWTGMHAWSSPDVRQPVAAVLDPDLDVAVLGWYGEWAQVQCSNGWRAWVDGRLLVPIWG